MFRRFFWLILGVGVGVGGSFWVTRFVKETAARYAPQRVSADVTGAIKGFRADLRQAVADGRVAMVEREAALRAELDPPRS